MKFLIAAIILFQAGLSAWASTNSYQLQMELYRNGKLLSHPQMVVVEGKAGSLSQSTDHDSSHIDVLASEAPGKSVRMELTVAYQDKVARKRVGGQPTIVVREGMPAEVSFSPYPGAPAELSLRVTAKKVKSAE
jgi:hypothetical protein